MNIKVYHKIDKPFTTTYKGDFNTRAFKLVDEFIPQRDTAPAAIMNLLEWVYFIHNAVDSTSRNVHLRVRSLSVGDVVQLDSHQYTVRNLGWEKI